MVEPTIACPSCRTEIRLTEQLAAPLLAAERRAIATREAEVAQARAALAEEVASRVGAERGRLAAEARVAAQVASAAEVGEMRAALAARDAKLAAAQAAQADAIRAERAFADKTRELDLTIETRVGQALGAARDQARRETEEAMKLKVAEKEQVIAGMQRTIEELKRRSEQGSQQLQGEVLELDLEAQLAARFPHDLVEPVGRGLTGADLIQRVRGPGGMAAGVILWEVKRTKAWNAEWLVKLRGDQRALGAQVGLIVSEALPKGVESFELIDGVWVAPPRLALPLATALRATLVDLAKAGAVRDGQATKMELVYDYLTGPRFRHRVEAIVEKFRAMEDDLKSERARTLKAWARREMQIQGVIEATMGMYGDLEGIAGKALGELKGLDAPAPDGQDG